MFGGLLGHLGLKRKHDSDIMGDPWFWSTQQLHQSLLKLNPTTDFRQILEQQQTNGAVFLLQVSEPVLTESWGITTPDVRSAILDVRDSLRKLSPAYQQMFPTTTFQVNGIPVSGDSTAPGPSQNQQTTAGATQADPTLSIRRNETYVTDAFGKKRRKLDLLNHTLSRNPAPGEDRSENENDTEQISEDEGEDADDESEGIESEVGDYYASLMERWDAQYAGEDLPVYGESDYDEDELSDEFVAELERDRKEEIVQPKHLTKDWAEEIIGEEIQRYENEWVQNKKPLFDAKAWQLWTKYKTDGERQKAVNIDEDLLENLKDRHKDIVKALLKDLAISESELRKLCVALEETVKERQSRKHRIAVLKALNPPLKPAVAPRMRKKTVRRPVVADDDAASINLSSSDDEFIEHDAGDEKHINQFNAAPLQQSTQDQVMTDIQPSQETEPFSDDEIDFDVHDFKQGAPHVEVRKSWEAQGQEFSATPLQDPDPIIRRWDMEMLEYLRNGPRIIMMLIWRASEESDLLDFFNWLNKLSSQSKDALFDEVVLTLEAFVAKERHLYDYSDEHFAYLKILAKMFMCSFHNSARPMRITESEFFNLATSAAGAYKRLSKPILGSTDQNAKAVRISFQSFLAFVGQAWSIYEQRKRQAQIESQDLIVLSSDEHDDSDSSDVQFVGSTAIAPAVLTARDDTIVQPTAFLAAAASATPTPLTGLPTPRKRVVKQDRTAAEKRRRAKERFQEVQTRSLAALTSDELQTEHTTGHICINPGKSADEPFIFINEFLSQQLQPHQIDGVRFLWAQVTETEGEDYDSVPGCLLAHSMGLGKTLQALTLLATLAEASHESADPAQRAQVPPALQKTRVLILVPAGLVSNWEAEFKKWITTKTLAYKAIGAFHVCRSDELKTVHRDTIASWFEDGGVLLIGQEGFRSWVRTKANTDVDETQPAQQIRDWLTKGPRMAIIDEAHKIKNSDTLLRQCVDMIETPIRIAMTGSPLSNNLGEYYQILDWACPGYLGGSGEFDAYYKHPINDGSYLESTPDQKALSRRRVKELEHETMPKVHKRDRDVLNSRLKQKTEFIITVPLTEFQRAIYNRYADYLSLQATDSSRKHASFLAWVDIMGRICSHPHVFINTNMWQELKLLAVMPDQAYSIVQGVVDNDDDLQNVLQNASATEQADLLALYHDVNQIVGQVADVEDTAHSHRISLLLQILEESLRVKDQILVFTHSLKQLDWLEKLLGSRGLPALVISGRTPVRQRVELIDGFNQGSHRIALLSTKAGALGFNITGANRAVLLDFSFNPQWEIQAASRVWRLGQEKEVYIYRFLAGGTFEEESFKDAVFKTQLAGKVVKNKNLENMATKEKRYLRHAEDVPQSDLTPELGKDKILDIILREHLEGRDRGVRAVRTTDMLETEREDEWTQENQRQIVKSIGKRRAETAKLKAAAAAPMVSVDPSMVAQESAPVPAADISPTAPTVTTLVPPPAAKSTEVIDLSSEVDEPSKPTATVAPIVLVAQASASQTHPYTPSMATHTRTHSNSSHSMSDLEVAAAKPAQSIHWTPNEDIKGMPNPVVSSGPPSGVRNEGDIERMPDLVVSSNPPSDSEKGARNRSKSLQKKPPKFQPNAAKAGGRRSQAVDMCSVQSQTKVNAPSGTSGLPLPPNVAKAGDSIWQPIDITSDGPALKMDSTRHNPVSTAQPSKPSILGHKASTFHPGPFTLPPKPPALTPNVPPLAESPGFISLDIPGSYPPSERPLLEVQAFTAEELSRLPTGPKSMGGRNTYISPNARTNPWSHRPFTANEQNRKEASQIGSAGSDGARGSQQNQSRDDRSHQNSQRQGSPSSKRDVIPRDDVSNVLSGRLQRRLLGPKSRQQRSRNSKRET